MKLHKQQLLLWSFSRKYTRKGTNTNSPPLSIEPPRKKSYQIGKWNIHIFCCRVIQSNKSAFYFAKWTWTELNYAEHLVYTVRNMHGAQLSSPMAWIGKMGLGQADQHCTLTLSPQNCTITWRLPGLCRGFESEIKNLGQNLGHTRRHADTQTRRHTHTQRCL